jgi:rubredoxin
MPVNLSCGKCNAIRSFSGDPPACEVCGWVYKPASEPALSPLTPSSDMGNSSSQQTLYCDKCKATRPFFGTTPVCYECGWVYDPSSKQASKSAKTAVTQTKNDFSFGSLIFVIILGLIVWLILPVRWTDPFLYSTEYQINGDQVHRNNKPSDCDFMFAPLGDKGCHYKKTVTAYNAAGNAVAGDDAPRYSNNTYGNPIISYDDGKTWQVLDSPAPDLKVKSVEIDWVKVTD